MARASAYPLEEYRLICEMMRGYAMLRFYQTALLLGTSGGLVTAFASQRAQPGAAGRAAQGRGRADLPVPRT